MIRFAADAITAFSVVPLMASMTIGWVMAAVGFAFFVYSIVGWLVGRNLPGWTSLMAAVGLLGGMQFLMLGIIGAYLGRLYDQSKGRPLFMIRDIVGGPTMKPAEFDRHAARYDGGLDNPIKRLMGSSADQFIAVKARWLLRREPGIGGRRPGRARLWLRRRRPDARAGRARRARVASPAATSRPACWPRSAKRWPAALGPRADAGGPGRCAHALRRRPVRHRHDQRRAAPRAARPSARPSIASSAAC